MYRIVLLLLCLTLSGCPLQPIERTARDVHAGAAGFLRKAQDNHLQECLDYRDKGIDLGKSAAICPAINKGAAAQRLLGTAINIYCASDKYLTGEEPCAPQLGNRAQLQRALDDFKAIAKELRKLGVIR